MAPYKTRKPQISDTAINLVRSAAHRYVRAGGSMFPVQDDDEAEQHIGNVHAMLGGDADQIDSLLDTLDLPFDTREKLIWSTAWSIVSSHRDSAFLFGAFVGLELAALNGAPVVVPKRRAAKKGGTR